MKKYIFKILILIVLILLVLITSFRTGTKYYLIKNTFNTKSGLIRNGLARWNFKAKVTIKNEVIFDEKL